jgi:GNAT superfamily N-acetyltransferase
VDHDAVRQTFDRQLRQRVASHGPDAWTRRSGSARLVGADGSWAGIIWSDLEGSDPDAVIAGEIEHFAARGGPWEWKHYSYDLPADLPARLQRAGLRAQPVEGLLVAVVAELDLDVHLPEGVRLAPVVDDADIEALVAVHDTVFGGDHAAIGAELAQARHRSAPDVVGVVAWAGDTPISAGRLQLHAGTDFASLWGGGTRPEWRGRGVFRALVAHRARLAAAAGFSYLQVDASADSRPILERLGFVHLADTTPWVHPGT